MKITAKTFSYGGKDYSIACENRFLIAYKEIGGHSCVIADYDGDVLFEISGVISVSKEPDNRPLKEFKKVAATQKSYEVVGVYVKGQAAKITARVYTGSHYPIFEMALQEGWQLNGEGQ